MPVEFIDNSVRARKKWRHTYWIEFLGAVDICCSKQVAIQETDVLQMN